MRLLRAEAIATTASDCFVAPLLAMTGRAEIQVSGHERWLDVTAAAMLSAPMVLAAFRDEGEQS
ncbi:MAG: hypothetical protein KKD24_10625 [Proteobacteria bacterium]|nr:hypothetical protein [Pseudomonadota bacterium]